MPFSFSERFNNPSEEERAAAVGRMNGYTILKDLIDTGNLNNKEDLERKIALIKSNPHFSVPDLLVPGIENMFENWPRLTKKDPELIKFILSKLMPTPDVKDIYSKEDLLKQHPQLNAIVNSSLTPYLDPRLGEILKNTKTRPPIEPPKAEVLPPPPKESQEDLIRKVRQERLSGEAGKNPSLGRTLYTKDMADWYANALLHPEKFSAQDVIEKTREFKNRNQTGKPSEAAAPENVEAAEPAHVREFRKQERRRLQNEFANILQEERIIPLHISRLREIKQLLEADQKRRPISDDNSREVQLYNRLSQLFDNSPEVMEVLQNKLSRFDLDPKLNKILQDAREIISKPEGLKQNSKSVSFQDPENPVAQQPIVPSAASPTPLTSEALKALGEQQSAPKGRKVYSDATESVAGTESENIRETQRDIIRNPEDYRQPAQDQLENEHNYRQEKDFEFDPLPQPAEGEHYLAALNRWMSQQALKYLKTKFKTNSPLVADDALIHSAETAMMNELLKGTEKSDEEKDFGRFYKDLLANYKNNTQTKSQALLDLAAEDITQAEVDKYKNPHVKGLMDELFSRDSERYDKEKRRRREAFNDEMMRRFPGNTYNSGARTKFQKNFEEQERERERDFYNDVSRREQELLFKGDVEGWARAKAKREALERNAQLNEGVSQNRFRNAAEATQARVNMNNAQVDRRLKLQLAQQQLGKERTEREQEKRNLEQAQMMRAQMEPLNRLRAAQGVINNYQVPMAPETSLPTMRPPEPQRSMASNLGGTILGMNNAYQEQQNAAAKRENLLLQNQLMAKKLAGAGGVPPLDG